MPPVALREVVSEPGVRELMKDILTRVVEEGTGRRAQIPGYRVAGKTGTAQILKGGAVDDYVASFAAFAPAEDPRFLVFVLLSRPRRDRGTPYGGTCAAPCVLTSSKCASPPTSLAL